ncbi:unnamed protein product [Porites evermanni]|uniref:BTB domain-containing protein n=1 Tax=Porites evermanni TaxID=104178 RepID=A0ABN8T247_9CNID|nr:unnamed protein product [Porites evermanni]
MATLDDNWQTKRPTISERTKFIFNNELLSDVKFVVPASHNESESRKSQKCIPAHKFILAISSPVFFAMFYGEMAETSGTIQLPDCDYESLFELFRFLYSNEVNLSGSNVMQVLYLAKKYLVPSLAVKCSEYLQEHLEASNVFSVLPQTQKFEDKDLEERCWDVIETHTENALTSEEFVTLERSVVEAVVKRERLNVKEVDLFKAVDRWATKEVERQRLTPDGVVKRRILGEEIVKAIRFPVMSQKEFASVVVDCDILTRKEIGLMMKHYSGFGLDSSLPFMNSIRVSLLHRVYRFEKPGGISDRPWNYFGKSDAINLTVSKPVILHGVQHFGSAGGKYTVSLEVVTKDGAIGVSLLKLTGRYSSEKDETNDYYGFDVMFDVPVSLERGKIYEIVSHIEGPSSWHVINGKYTDEVEGIKFSFSNSKISKNATDASRGQFPALIFSTK